MAITTPLEDEIRKTIAIAGPMPVGKYMATCLFHPRYGYYMNNDPLGSAGDFTTAPEISQMFGELLGLWAAAVWRMMGTPPAINLIELGPGRGTMMSDMLRAARVVPGFDAAISVHLVEASTALRSRQKMKLAKSERPVAWYDVLTEVPPGPAIIFANEFFDALPVNQAVKRDDGWHERLIEIRDDRLAFTVAPEPLCLFERTLPSHVRSAPDGAIFEWRSQKAAFDIGKRVAAGGAALIVDYGHVQSDVGETLQAVRGHRFEEPLVSPGLVDLSAHVDFGALALAASTMGASVHGPVEQATFLRSLGIEKRAAALKARMTPDQSADVDLAHKRLTVAGKTGMGTLFKVIGLSDSRLKALPGLDARLVAAKPA